MWGIPFPTERVIEVTQFLTVINQSRVRKKKPKDEHVSNFIQTAYEQPYAENHVRWENNQMAKIRFAAHTVSIDGS